jgi:hypothetical protein
MGRTIHLDMSREETRTNTEATKVRSERVSATIEGTESREVQEASEPKGQRDKISVNVGHDISERLRSLAYSNRLSESSIVEVALTMFFARGDDELLGAILKQLGATLRRK